jgi:DNA (cytosine-5)-methyltransferase 1
VLTPFRVLDLFSGCGGISWGFKKAGFQILAGVDQDKEALETFALNMPEAQAIDHDLSGQGVTELVPILGLSPGELDVLVGGPPCQGFSKNVTRSGRFLEDPKNLLVRSFMDAVEALSPKVVLMENVATMANAFGGAFREELLQRFSDCGYEVRYKTHNAAEHGLPQRRKRVVFLASRVGLPEPLARQAHVPSRSGTHKTTHIPAGAISVWDAIGDLGRIDLAAEIDESNQYFSEPFSEFQTLMRSGGSMVLSDHTLRPLRSKQQARYDALEPGQGLRDLPPELQTKGGYSGAYGRLTKTMVAPTITRWCFHPGSGRFGHPVERRILTIREAARLQGFSDDFRFSGSNHKKSWQVGNAVPPLLARAFAEQIAAVLAGKSVPT